MGPSSHVAVVVYSGVGFVSPPDRLARASSVFLKRPRLVLFRLSSLVRCTTKSENALATRLETVIRKVRTMRKRSSVVTIVLALLTGPAVASAQCVTDGTCATPCPAENSCQSDSECGPGETCVPFGSGIPCISGFCGCEDGEWICTDDCAPQCVVDVPAVSAWGQVAMSLLLLTAASVAIRRRAA